ncbi:hypothetical protein PV05_01055 [Exophiala xenobiotica]|uniref:Uncharacterized protein n=1 Tax=Exophiala xenobiotica TaxID=348802 RepID=A0A0D2DEZ3_9EURO|nr:uncharacterized protein PV05_01055 [Exophiala xenobiotica]KIW60872.1 hypothetical protein PV05_01055 [Exophiala xenobiotica]
MVLLTSSAVSMAISSGVVCIFTFLLFMSGYVLQQQTVRSLQEALRAPPEPKPVPILPPQFQKLDNDSSAVVVEQRVDAAPPNSDNRAAEKFDRLLESVQVPVVAHDESQVLLQDSSERTSSHQQASEQPPMQRLAYMFILLEPSDLCSTLLFAKQQRSSSRLATQPSIVLLYPGTWEAESSQLYLSALSFMREIQELYGLIYHPVRINDAWDTNAQLLGELQWHRWEYDQALYLKSPGIILDNKALDIAITSPVSRKTWSPVDTSTGNNPDVLLVTPKGLQSPRREMRKLASPAISGHTNDHETELYVEDVASKSAYVVMNLDHLGDGGHGNVWYKNLIWKFERGVKNACAGSGLLE